MGTFFLDTSVIIDLFANPESFDKNKPVKGRVENTHKLFDYFKGVTNKSDKKYMFYVSSVTIAEITRGDNKQLFDALLILFSSSELTFVDFTKDIAFQISQNIRKYIPAFSQKQLISFISKNLTDDNKYLNVRNWILDDLKIASTAKSVSKLDVILTADKKTFYPIAEKLKLPVIETNNLPKTLFDDISSTTDFV